MHYEKTVLLVEDDKDDQAFFVKAISKIENVRMFDIVSNGREAIEWLKKSQVLPGFIFMDINMPIMNGIDCLSEISENDAFKRIPVVMLSTTLDQQDQTIELGARGFIKKPDDLATLRYELELIFEDSQVG